MPYLKKRREIVEKIENLKETGRIRMQLIDNIRERYRKLKNLQKVNDVGKWGLENRKLEAGEQQKASQYHTLEMTKYFKVIQTHMCTIHYRHNLKN